MVGTACLQCSFLDLVLWFYFIVARPIWGSSVHQQLLLSCGRVARSTWTFTACWQQVTAGRPHSSRYCCMFPQQYDHRGHAPLWSVCPIHHISHGEQPVFQSVQVESTYVSVCHLVEHKQMSITCWEHQLTCLFVFLTCVSLSSFSSSIHNNYFHE